MLKRLLPVLIFSWFFMWAWNYDRPRIQDYLVILGVLAYLYDLTPPRRA